MTAPRRLRVGVALAAAGIALYLGAWLLFAGAVPPPDAAAPGPGDGIVVLTGGANRIARGFDLLAAGQGMRLLITGVHRGVDLATLLAAAGRNPEQVPATLAARIDLDYTARNTRENARETRDWMIGNGFHSLRLVTTRYHMPRSLQEFRHAMPAVRIIPVAVDDRGRATGSGLRTLVRTHLELAKFVLSRLHIALAG